MRYTRSGSGQVDEKQGIGKARIRESCECMDSSLPNSGEREEDSELGDEF